MSSRGSGKPTARPRGGRLSKSGSASTLSSINPDSTSMLSVSGASSMSTSPAQTTPTPPNNVNNGSTTATTTSDVHPPSSNMADIQKQALAHLISQLKSKQITGKDFQVEATKLLGPEKYTELIRKPAAQMAAAAQQQRIAQQQTSSKQREEDPFDRLDGAALQDVLKYSNIDLKAESELILGMSSTSKQVPLSTAHTNIIDPRSKPTHYCNSPRLRYMVTKIANRTNPSLIKTVEEEAVSMIAAALQRRMSDILASCVEYSRHRVDRGRANWKIKIMNDPRKQIGILEQVIKAQEAMLYKEEGGGEEGGSSGGIKVDSEQRPTPFEQQQQLYKKARPNPTTPVLATESTSIKAKMANSAVMAAVGLKRKDWMTTTPTLVVTSSGGSGSTATNNQSADAETASTSPALEPSISFSTAPSATLLTDSQLYAAFTGRTINARDLTAVVEADHRLARSHLALMLYDLASQE